MRPILRELTGQIFNGWTVLKRAPTIQTPGGQYKTYWFCQCKCGKYKTVYTNSLTSGKSKSCNCSKRKLPSGMSAKRTMINGYKGSARRKNIVYGLTEAQFSYITQQECFYCGIGPSNKAGGTKQYGKYLYNGIDRVNNTLGYTLDNVVPCCKNCNLAKRSLTQEEFFKLIKTIYKRCIDGKS